VPVMLKPKVTVLAVPTDINDRGLAIRALDQLGLAYEERGATALRVTSGDLADATIDLMSGVVSGRDHSPPWREALGCLRQAYAELKFRAEAATEGVEIKQRIVHPDGRIELHCRMPSRAHATTEERRVGSLMRRRSRRERPPRE